MSLFGWLLAVTYLCLEIYHRPAQLLALSWVPIILAFFSRWFLGAPSIPLPPDRSPWPSFSPCHVHAQHPCIRGVSRWSCVLSLHVFLGKRRLLRMRKVGGRCLAPALRWELLERNEPYQRSRGTCHHRRWHSSRIYRGGSPGRPATGISTRKYIVTLVVLLSVPRLFPVGADHGPGEVRVPPNCAVFNFVLVVLSFTVVNLYFSSHPQVLLGARLRAAWRSYSLA